MFYLKLESYDFIEFLFGSIITFFTVYISFEYFPFFKNKLQSLLIAIYKLITSIALVWLSIYSWDRGDLPKYFLQPRGLILNTIENPKAITDLSFIGRISHTLMNLLPADLTLVVSFGFLVSYFVSRFLFNYIKDIPTKNIKLAEILKFNLIFIILFDPTTSIMLSYFGKETLLLPLITFSLYTLTKKKKNFFIFSNFLILIISLKIRPYFAVVCVASVFLSIIYVILSKISIFKNHTNKIYIGILIFLIFSPISRGPLEYVIGNIFGYPNVLPLIKGNSFFSILNNFPLDIIYSNEKFSNLEPLPEFIRFLGIFRPLIPLEGFQSTNLIIAFSAFTYLLMTTIFILLLRRKLYLTPFVSITNIILLNFFLIYTLSFMSSTNLNDLSRRRLYLIFPIVYIFKQKINPHKGNLCIKKKSRLSLIY